MNSLLLSKFSSITTDTDTGICASSSPDHLYQENKANDQISSVTISNFDTKNDILNDNASSTDVDTTKSMESQLSKKNLSTRKKIKSSEKASEKEEEPEYDDTIISNMNRRISPRLQALNIARIHAESIIKAKETIPSKYDQSMKIKTFIVKNHSRLKRRRDCEYDNLVSNNFTLKENSSNVHSNSPKFKATVLPGMIVAPSSEKDIIEAYKNMGKYWYSSALQEMERRDSNMLTKMYPHLPTLLDRQYSKVLESDQMNSKYVSNKKNKTFKKKMTHTFDQRVKSSVLDNCSSYHKIPSHQFNKALSPITNKNVSFKNSYVPSKCNSLDVRKIKKNQVAWSSPSLSLEIPELVLSNVAIQSSPSPSPSPPPPTLKMKPKKEQQIKKLINKFETSSEVSNEKQKDFHTLVEGSQNHLKNSDQYSKQSKHILIEDNNYILHHLFNEEEDDNNAFLEDITNISVSSNTFSSLNSPEKELDMNVLDFTCPESNEDDHISTTSCNASIFANYSKSIKSENNLDVITPNPNNNQNKKDKQPKVSPTSIFDFKMDLSCNNLEKKSFKLHQKCREVDYGTNTSHTSEIDVDIHDTTFNSFKPLKCVNKNTTNMKFLNSDKENINPSSPEIKSVQGNKRRQWRVNGYEDFSQTTDDDNNFFHPWSKLSPNSKMEQKIFCDLMLGGDNE